ncbi:hypothetical protein P308_20145 [Pseudomonas piscis]|nr:hypothetical protein P308_20145 [Pseudomonas piscis]
MPTMGESSGLSARPSSGNSTNVRPKTSKCRRQWPAPAMIASRESLAPWRKNSRPMARLVSQAKPVATWPLAGRKLASKTTPIRVRVKLSGNRRERDMSRIIRGVAKSDEATLTCLSSTD